jgi:uncharacterized membrane protein
MFVSTGVGAVVGGVSALFVPWQVAVLLFWNGLALTMLIGTWPAALRMDAATTEKVATKEDDSRTTAQSLVLGASVASLGAVGLAVSKASNGQGLGKNMITGVAVASVVLSWAVVHTVFTLRYAHCYYRAGGGVEFNEDTKPDYQDFAYLAFTVGMTYQVSDTNITTREIRRLILRHALLSFMFGTAIIAMTINVVAQLIGGGSSA